ncbi:uncharacterized protein C5L36_0B10010 [Pichia kudriavzevii]|uniref:Small nuclear ribonucleoprotein Sm D1 n=1 Tax=Pichia kudriavzevii TaxID=4909 RepID=A0A099NR53_PICKU|nr:uncharacterized protein C5L36_0B10010 [Pichia kudriavzevii]AWU75763.1 hypothetical protein C5L36_0B10010 [Pichia kudriavzevii]KGK34554.1 hypothetical protein JL09_g6298 [Pichia kudriavzevii]ONH77314.1 Small nuclear ribonucleoprotein Sm D1 [Pichia kudriavzevii]
MKLVRLLMKMQNETVQVELKSGVLVHGTIVTVSPNMNITLKDVKMTVPHRSPTQLEHIMVRGSQVRMVLLPDDLNLDALLQDPIFSKKQEKPLSAPQGRGGASKHTYTKAPKRTTNAHNRGF